MPRLNLPVVACLIVALTGAGGLADARAFQQLSALPMGTRSRRAAAHQISTSRPTCVWRG